MKKILIVDDSTFMRNVVKDILENGADSSLKNKLELYEADGKTNAISQVNKIKPDVILLDIVMKESEMEGLEFLEEIKSFFDLRKIIMISSIGQQEILHKCKVLGIQHYLQKPIENEQVYEALSLILK